MKHLIAALVLLAAPVQDKTVLVNSDFESDSWKTDWAVQGKNFTVVEGHGRGKSLRMEIPAGQCGGGSLIYPFKKRLGTEPEEMYFRYYLKFDPSWANAIDGGKMPGISGTYGRAGWGGRGPVNGKDGWSARGGFKKPGADSCQLSFYCYHVDTKSPYGDHWKFEPPLKYDTWYCVEVYCKLNTPGKDGGKGANDGILRSWIDGQVAFERTNIRFRDVDTLKIEQVWGNFYHGGTRPTPKSMVLFLDDMVISTKPIGPLKNGKS
jgi:hypothetical protein